MNEATNLITAEGLKKLEAELETLETEGRREIAERIKVAREWGDLKENSEYHDAKNEQSRLETRILRLREKIAAARVVDGEAAADGAVAFGSTVLVRASEGEGAERTWVIVSSHDASPRDGRLSVDSPVARALMGRRAGESVSVSLPRGESLLTIVSVE